MGHVAAELQGQVFVRGALEVNGYTIDAEKMILLEHGIQALSALEQRVAKLSAAQPDAAALQSKLDEAIVNLQGRLTALEVTLSDVKHKVDQLIELADSPE